MKKQRYNGWRKGIVYLALLTAQFSLSGCSLDESPHDQVPQEKAFDTAKEVYLNTVATLYNYIGGSEDGQGLQGTCRGVYDLQTFGSDEAMLPTRGTDWYDGEMWQDMYRHSWTPGHSLLKNSWLYLYKVITLCNSSLEQIEEHKALLGESLTAQYSAEVRALRAIYYWYLLDLFGRVPLITSSKVPLTDVRQSERSEVFRFVVSELQEALLLVPDGYSSRRGEVYGRVTEPVVDFVLAKLMLNAEVYSDDDWTDGIRPDGSAMHFSILGSPMNAWEATIFFCDLLENMDYRLETDYESNFAVYNESSKENIWVIPVDKDLYKTQQQNLFRSYHYRHAAAYGFTGENGSCATLRTLDIFGYGTDELDTRFYYNYWADEVYDLNGDPVLDRQGNPLVYMPRAVQMDLSGTPYVETAGARMKKYEIDRNATSDGKLMDNDIVLFRFADVLLMRAEAYLRSGQASKGQADFNAVRKRSLMDARPLTLQNILDERLLELCWEGWRRQDLIRFDQYESLFMGDFFNDKVDESDHHTIVYPIPADIITLNSNIRQNPGY